MAVGLADNRDRPGRPGGADSPYLGDQRGSAVRPEPVEQQVLPATSAPAGGRTRGPGRPPFRRLTRGLGRRRDILAVIAAGGAVGSLARWGVAQALPHAPAVFPWATVLTNVSGCFALGVLVVLTLEVWPPSRYLRPFAGVGVLGGYTTFSTAMLDTRSLAAAGRPGVALAYLAGSTAGGLLAVAAAVLLTRAAVRPRATSRRTR
jgi:CrcB protein